MTLNTLNKKNLPCIICGSTETKGAIYTSIKWTNKTNVKVCSNCWNTMHANKPNSICQTIQKINNRTDCVSIRCGNCIQKQPQLFKRLIKLENLQ